MEGGEQQVDADQLAALRRLGAVFGHIEVIAIRADAPSSGGTPEGRPGVLEEHDGRPAEDDTGAAGRGGPAATSGGDNAGAGDGQ